MADSSSTAKFAVAPRPPMAEYQMFPACETVDAPNPQGQYFKLFSYLSEDLKATVLSFVADAPFEMMPQNYPKSSLTHALPAVNRQFRSMCNDGNLFWKDGVVRMTKQEPRLWKTALHRLSGEGAASTISSSISTKEDTIVELVERTHKILTEKEPALASYKSIYETIVNKFLRFKGPVFCMPGQIALGQSYSLHLFEWRYRTLIAQAMQGQPEEAKHGGRLLTDKPVYFLHANRAPLEPTMPAVVVQVLQCQIYPDGRADVVLLPVHFVWLERIWVRTDQGHLYYAQALKMGQAVTQQMNHLQRQEALANVMDRLAGELAAGNGSSSSSGSSDEDLSSSSSFSNSDESA